MPPTGKTATFCRKRSEECAHDRRGPGNRRRWPTRACCCWTTTRPCAPGWAARWSRAASSRRWSAACRRRWRRCRSTPPAFAVLDMRLEDGNGLQVVEALQQGAARRQGRHADRLRQHRHRRGRGEGRRDRLPVQARRRRRRGPRPAGRRRRGPRPAGQPDVAPTGSAGSTSSASTSSATTTSRRPRGGSTCTAAPCSASWPSARRGIRCSLLAPRTGELSAG